MVIRRGEIWFADLGEPLGSEPGYQRPVLIIQDNHFNDSKIATVIVLGMTSNLKYADIPGNVLLRKKDSLLKKDSVINVSQLTAIDKECLVKRISAVPQLIVDQVEYGIGQILGLH